MRLESNDVAVLLRSDRRDHIDVAHKALFADLKLFNRSLKELRYCARVFAPYRGDRRCAP